MSQPEDTQAPTPEKPEKSAYERLTPRYRRFVDFLLQGKSGADAARLSGCKGKRPAIWACKAKKIPGVIAAIAEREAEAMDEAGISLTRSWREIACIAYFDKRKLYDGNGSLVPVNQLDDETAAAVASIEIEDTRAGPVRKYKTWSKLEANKLILQKKGEIVDKHEDLTPRATPVIQIVRYSDSQAAGDAGTDPPRADRPAI